MGKARTSGSFIGDIYFNLKPYTVNDDPGSSSNFGTLTFTPSRGTSGNIMVNAKLAIAKIAGLQLQTTATEQKQLQTDAGPEGKAFEAKQADGTVIEGDAILEGDIVRNDQTGITTITVAFIGSPTVKKGVND